jgi:hypothetical protein
MKSGRVIMNRKQRTRVLAGLVFAGTELLK